MTTPAIFSDAHAINASVNADGIEAGIVLGGFTRLAAAVG